MSNLFNGLFFTILTAVITAFGLLFFSFFLEKRNAENEKTDSIIKEIKKLGSELEGEKIDPNGHHHLRDIALKIGNIKYTLTENIKQNDLKMGRIKLYIEELKLKLSKELEFLKTPSINIEFENFNFDFINDVSEESEQIELSVFEEKIYKVSEQFNENYEKFKKIFEFLDELYEKLLILRQISDGNEILLENMKLVYLNVQLEAFKKGKIAEEFLVIGEEIKQLYEESIKNVKDEKEILKYFIDKEVIIREAGEMKILFENLLQIINSVLIDILDIKEKVSHTKENNENIYNTINEIRSKCMNFKEYQRDLKEKVENYNTAIDEYLNRFNTSIMELNNYLQYLEEFENILRGE